VTTSYTHAISLLGGTQILWGAIHHQLETAQQPVIVEAAGAILFAVTEFLATGSPVPLLLVIDAI
jgi:hypothetical protein